MACRLTYLYLVLTHSKCQGHKHFDCEYLYKWRQIGQTFLFLFMFISNT